MESKKKSFVLYEDTGNLVELLSDEQAGKVFKSLFAYITQKDMPEIDEVAKIVFVSIKNYLDRDTAKYDEICQKRAQFGKKGGIAKATNSKQKVAKATHNENVTDNKNERDNNSVNDSKNVTENKSYYPQDELLNDTFLEYIAMREKLNASMTDKAIELTQSELHKLSNGDNEKAIAILNQSIMNSWKGLFELKSNTSNSTKQDTSIQVKENYDNHPEQRKGYVEIF